jgi:hypothetical protein
MQIHSLEGQIESSRLYSVVLANRFDASSTSTEKTKIARQHDHALKQAHALQLMLELLKMKCASEKTKTDG